MSEILNNRKLQYKLINIFRFRVFSNITGKEKNTFKLHIIYSIIDGLILGLFALNEFILIKSLKGTNYQLGFLIQFTVIVLLLSIVINEILKRIRRKKKFIRYIAVFTRLPLILFAFFPKNIESLSSGLNYPLIFLFIFLIYFLANPLLFPTINHLLKNSYSHDNFGKLYGYAETTKKIMMLIATFLFGLLLDADNYSFTVIYPVVAILGVLSIFILTKIEYEATKIKEVKDKIFTSVKKSFFNMVKILKTNKPFLDFEISFMFYGFGWMVSAAIIAIFFEKSLQLNYSSIAFYKNAYNALAIILLPYFGKLIGKIDPRKFSVFTFGAMLLHILFMAITEYLPFYFEVFGLKLYYTLIISYMFYGIFAATMALLWYIGSAYFCTNEEAGEYQSIHLTTTGFRGVFAPIVGIFFYELFGFTIVFSIAIFSLFGAMLVMYFSMKKKKLVN